MIRYVILERATGLTEPRFDIFCADTGRLLDDAQGYGFRSREKAHNFARLKFRERGCGVPKIGNRCKRPDVVRYSDRLPAPQNEDAYRRGVHQAVAMALDVVAYDANTLEEARLLLRHAEVEAGKLRYVQTDQGGLRDGDLLTVIRQRVAEQMGGRSTTPSSSTARTSRVSRCN